MVKNRKANKSSNPNVNEPCKRGLSRAKRDTLNRKVEELLQKCSSASSLNSAIDWEKYNESWDVLVSICELEKTNVEKSPSASRTAAFEPFMEWLQSHGAEMGDVKLVELPFYGCCVQASGQVVKSDRLFSIPQKLMLTSETAKASNIGSFIENDPILSQMPNVALAFHILNEMYDSNSFWSPYLNTLPSSYDTVMYYTPKEIELLKGSPAFDDALKMCKNIARQYSYFYSLLQKNKDPVISNLRANFSYTDYRWAVSTVMTRQNLIPSKDGTSQMNALIPLWDFCNHQEGEFSTDFDGESQRSVCQANRDFGAGEQVFIFYGQRTCAEQFIHNGFVDINNSYDAFPLKIGLSKSDPLACDREALLRKLNIIAEEKLSGPLTFQLSVGTQPVDGKLLAFLRLFSMTKDSLQYWLQSENRSNLMHEECGIDTEVENKSWSFLKARSQLLLNMYPTTKDEDSKLLESDLSQHHRTCVLLRLAEKRILLSTIEYATHKIRK